MERASSLPVWIHKRDGRLVPFQADKISQSLFAASESLGRPDAFTARELTDGVLHFLCAELNGAIPQTGQVAEMSIKIVRELGQGAIAQAYADFSTKRSQRPPREEKEAAIESSRVSAGRGGQPRLPSTAAMASLDNVSLVREVAATYLTNFSLEEIFTRDIAAAHREGLIILMGLETPFEIQGGTLQGWSKPLSLALEDARQSVGQFIVLDGPEFASAAGSSGTSPMIREDWAQALLFGLRTQGLCAVVNLNAAVPPPWAQSLAAGPLFDPNSSRLSLEHGTERADEFLETLVSRATWGRVQWHLSEQDWTPRNASRTNRLARHLLQRAPITIAFDRTPRALSLSEGLDRRNSSLLISVGLNLPGLSRMLGEEAKPELFLQKLGSLARLAITAAVQKRRFITRYRRKQPAFLVDRARLAVVPVGLESVTRRYTGQNILSGNAGADFACRIIRGLGETLREEGSIYNLDAVLDSAPSHEAWPVMGSLTHFEVADQGSQLLPNIEEVAGLTTWNEDLTPAQQIQAGGLLHALVGAGTQWVLLPPGFSLKEEDMVAVLRTAWKETQANRIRFVSLDHEGRQLTAPWEGSERDLLLTGPAGTPTMRASES